VTRTITVEEFSDLVESIYAAALDPTEWERFARLLVAATESSLGGVGVLDVSTSDFVQHFGYGIPPDYFERVRAVRALNPMLPHTILGKPGDLMVNSLIVPEDEFVQGQFYRDFIQPLGLRDCMGVTCLRSGNRIGILVVNRRIDQPLYTEEDGQLLRLLSPHICRAMTISDVFDLRTVKSEALEATLDGLAAGVFLLDADGRLVHSNRAAERLVRLGQILTVREQRMYPLHPASREALTAALVQPHSMTETTVPPAIALQPVDPMLTGMIATLLPLCRAGRVLSTEPFTAHWAVFVQDPHVAQPMPGEAFGKLYNLTPAELRVALACAQGLSPEMVTEVLGIALPTVRTHLQRLFAKTNTNRHADFIRLMLATMPPLGGPPA
jgi:DNA-binding CsgD family transcriptional regulator/PAS domain-containing protein